MIDATAAGTVADMNQLTATLAAAAGVDAARGDTIAVQTVPFDQSSAQAAQDALDQAAADQIAAEQAAAMDRYIEYGIAGAILLLFIIILAIRKASKNRRERREAVNIGEIADVPDDTLLLDGGVELELPQIEAYQPALESAERMRSELTELADKEPDVVAELLKGYLAGSGLGGRRGR
jgi:flagellar M-ring protein FliF